MSIQHNNDINAFVLDINLDDMMNNHQPPQNQQQSDQQHDDQQEQQQTNATTPPTTTFNIPPSADFMPSSDNSDDGKHRDGASTAAETDDPHGGGVGKKGKKGKKNKKMKEDQQNVVLYTAHNGDQYGLIPLAPKSKYDVKMHMTNERTFFKYLFCAFHLGAMGTFLLQYYSQPSFFKPVLIGLIWLLAFSFVGVGLFSYYQRRSYLKQGKMKNLTGLQMHGPTYVLLAFLFVFMSIVIYSIGEVPQKTKLHYENHPQCMRNGTFVTDPHADYVAQQRNTPPPFTTVLPV